MLGKIIFLVYLAKAIKAETISLSPNPTVQVSVNDPLTLTCTTTYSMRFLFITDSSLAISGTAITLRNSAGTCKHQYVRTGYEINCDPVNGPYQITIKSVNLQHHRSKITCTVQYGGSSTQDIASAETTILVNDPPVINGLTPTGTITKNVSDITKFQCSASGFPALNFKWHVGGSEFIKEYPPMSSDYTATSTFSYEARKADNGKAVKCTASNGINEDSASRSLRIQWLPVVEISPSYRPYNVVENTTNLDLKCTAKDASPIVSSYEWYREGSVISTTAAYTISNVYRSHGGIYTCNATNAIGSNTTVVTLNVLYGVIVNTIGTHQPIEGDDLSIICSGQSNPQIIDNNVKWTKQNNNTYKEVGKRLSIDNVNRNDSGIFICNVVVSLKSSEGNTTNVTGGTTVEVDVLYRPVVEIFPSYQPYNVIENTSNIQLRCNTKEANPAVTSYIWKKNGTTISTNAVFTMQPVAKSHRGDYTCYANNTVGQSGPSVMLEVNVLYGVAVDAISRQRPTEGNNLSISCTGQSNPPIQFNDVTWTSENNETFKRIGQQLIIHNIRRKDKGTFICTVVIRLTSSDGKFVNVTGTTNVQVDVLYRPVVLVYPLSNPYKVIENTTNLELNCTVTEANPANVTYSWYKNGKIISSKSVVSTRIHRISKVEKSHEGRYTCAATNEVGRSALSSELKLTVLYGVILDAIEKQTPTEGSYLLMNCTGQAYPPIEDSEVKWTKLNNNSFEQFGQQLIIQNVNKLDNGSYICTVNKRLTPSDGDAAIVIGTTSVIVDILFLPLVEIITNKDVEIQENATDLILTCSVKEANPEVGKYKWYKDGVLIAEEDDANKYIIEKVFRSDAGYYTCKGINSIGGSNSTSVDVNVLYGVTLNLSRRIITVNESDNFSILCTAFGNPLPKLTWINTFNRSVLDQEVNTDNKAMTVANANCIDTGIYACIGNNSIGDIAFYSINISVKCHPRTVDNQFTRIIVVNGMSGMLTISEVFISYPRSEVSWSRKQSDGNNTVLDHQFNISDYKSVLPFETVSTLHKDEMQRELFGTYFATAVNDYGSYVVTYIVIPKGKPQPPTNISATCGITSITVTWISRFDGGDNQTFRILFRHYDSNTTTWSSDDKPDEGEGRYITFREEALVPNSLYEIFIQAKNSFGGMNSSESISCITGKPIKSTSSALIGGVAGATSAFLIIFLAVISFFMIRRWKNQGKDKEPIKRNHNYHHTDEDEDGLKDNPLYGTTYSSETPRTDTEVTTKDMDEGPVYSQVEKVGSKGKKEKHEKKPKNVFKNGQDQKDIELGIVYENAEKLMKKKGDEDVYASASSGKEISQTVDSGSQYRSLKNKDGLIYADLDLVPQPNGKRFVIRGLENRNNYAIIDLSKTAEPLPSDDSDEEDTAKTQKS